MTVIKFADNIIGGNKLNSKLETAIDSNVIANNIMRDLIDVERMEKMFECELSSSDLFKIDCAILSTLQKTPDFSRDLLHQLETGIFETQAVKAPDAFEQIQQQAMMDITLPLQNMFDEMENYIIEAIES